MKLLLDQGTPRSTAALLRNVGHDAIHTAEVGLSAAEDEQLIAIAAQQERVVVTLDADFHAHLALFHAKKPSVIRIRIEGLKAADLAQLLENVLHQCQDDLNLGAMVSVQENRIRIRTLPIG
jgi:predicted nuclease of predicted toxin-antitoxin system